ncbi:hypothetical protein [Xenorhabdus miraniensis]|nr:hypothetical protein [Xenorhabdus miraniensis]
MIDDLILPVENWPSYKVLHYPDDALISNCPDENEFVLVLKPESLTEQKKADYAISLLKELLVQYGVQVMGISMFDSSYAKKHRVFEKQYSTLNFLARRGLGEVPYDSSLLEPHIEVMGAYRFLSEHDWTTKQLEEFSHSRDNIKLGNGAYVTLVDELVEKPIYVLNPFHPYQLENFYADDNRFMVFACRR